jgi:hypothetical protein
MQILNGRVSGYKTHWVWSGQNITAQHETILIPKDEAMYLAALSEGICPLCRTRTTGDSGLWCIPCQIGWHVNPDVELSPTGTEEAGSP